MFLLITPCTSSGSMAEASCAQHHSSYREDYKTYKMIRPRGKLCTYLHLDQETHKPTSMLRFVDCPYANRTWVPTDYYLHAQEIEIMKRETAGVQKTKGKYIAPPCKFLKDYPTITEWCGDCWWDDGKPRTPCHVKIEVIGDMVHIGLIDQEGRRSCHTTAGGLPEALELLEGHLAAGGAPWRSWGPQKR